MAMATTQQRSTIGPSSLRGRSSTRAVLLPSETSATISPAIRRSDTNPSSRLASNSYSGQSSSSMNDPAAGYNRRSSLAASTFNGVNNTPNAEDPYVAFQRSTQIFPSTGLSTYTPLPAHLLLNRRFEVLDMPERPHTWYTDSFPADTFLPDHTAPNRRFTILGMPERPHSWLPNSPSLESITDAQYLNYVPPTNIDWTLPSTRLREYQEIDRSSKGVRGLWRRYAPRWFHKNSRQGFFVENQGDTSSVRRHRLDMTNENENVDLVTGSVPVKEKKHRLLKNKIKQTFSRFTSRSTSNA